MMVDEERRKKTSMVPDIQGSRNSRRGSLVIAMLGIVLVVTGVCRHYCTTPIDLEGTASLVRNIQVVGHRYQQPHSNSRSDTSADATSYDTRADKRNDDHPTTDSTVSHSGTDPSSNTDSSDHGTTHFVTVDFSNGVVVVCE